MINYIRKIVTGYRVKKKFIGSTEIKFTYTGKFVLFDPIAIFQEITLKRKDHPELASMDKDFTFEKMWDSRISLIDNLPPSAIAEYEIEGGNFVVRRYVTKYKGKPKSIYLFSISGEDSVLYLRLYDYGAHINDFSDFVKNNLNSNLEENFSGYYMIPSGDQGFSIDVFGHTRFMMWNILPEN